MFIVTQLLHFSQDRKAQTKWEAASSFCPFVPVKSFLFAKVQLLALGSEGIAGTSIGWSAWPNQQSNWDSQSGAKEQCKWPQLPLFTGWLAYLDKEAFGADKGEEDTYNGFGDHDDEESEHVEDDHTNGAGAQGPA